MITKTLIIGGGSGIGRAVANVLVTAGHSVTIAGRDIQKLEEAQQSLAKGGSAQVSIISTDISDEKSIEQTLQNIGEFDHLIVTAGSSAPGGKIVDLELDAIKTAFGVKFWGSIAAAKFAAKHISQNGSITLTSGLLSRKVVPGAFAKTTINAALEAGAKVLARELAPVRVNVVSPGVTDTEAYSGMPKEAREGMFKGTSASLPVGRVGKAEEIARAYAMIIENDFMTGAVVDVDGGGLIS